MESALTKHQIYIQRLAGGINNDIIPILENIREQLLTKILTSTDYQAQRISILLREIETIINENVSTKLQPQLFAQLNDFADYESEFSFKLLDKETTSSAVLLAGASGEQLQALTSTSKLLLENKSFTPNELINVFSKRYSNDIKSIIDNGIIQGSTLEQIAKEVDSLSTTRTRQQAKALVRTLTNHYGDVARDSVWKENSDILQGYKFTATLDFRTTTQCGVRDGGIWSFSGTPLNDIAEQSSFRRPALHYNCRSVLVPSIKPEYDLKIDTTRAAKGGQVSAKTTYKSWLKSQPKEVIDDILGIERSKLFRSGKLSLDSFVDYSGKTYTLEELKRIEGI